MRRETATLRLSPDCSAQPVKTGGAGGLGSTCTRARARRRPSVARFVLLARRLTLVARATTLRTWRLPVSIRAIRQQARPPVRFAFGVETKRMCRPSTSQTLTLLAAAVPMLRTNIRYDTVRPERTIRRAAVLRRSRRGAGGVTAVLLDGFVSGVSLFTMMTLRVEPTATAATRTFTVAVSFAARSPKSQVIVRSPVHVPFVVVIEMKRTMLGKVSDATTLRAVDGPLFTTVAV
jgi:hypothetical protein